MCSGLHACYTNASNGSYRFPSRHEQRGDSVQRQAEYLAKCEASGDTGCELVTGQSWDNDCYGHFREDVSMTVDSLKCRSLVVTLDTEPKDTWLNG